MAMLTNDWATALDAEFKKPYYRELYKFVKQEYATTTIYPPAEDIFNALHYTPLSEVKVVILGQDPYHNVNQAHGLCFSVLPSQPENGQSVFGMVPFGKMMLSGTSFTSTSFWVIVLVNDKTPHLIQTVASRGRGSVFSLTTNFTEVFPCPPPEVTYFSSSNTSHPLFLGSIIAFQSWLCSKFR